MDSMYVSIAGTKLSPQPSFNGGYTVSYQDVSSADSGRTEDGVMHNTIVTRKVKLQLKFPYMTVAQAKAILALVDAPEFSVTYPDPYTDSLVTKTFYKGDRSMGFYTFNTDITSFVVSGFGFDVIEV